MTLARLDTPVHESAALVGLTGDRIDAVRMVDLSEGDGSAMTAVQALLRDSEAVAMVVFTEQRPPQWVDQPCYLPREVLVVSASPAGGHLAPDARAHGMAEDGDRWGDRGV